MECAHPGTPRPLPIPSRRRPCRYLNPLACPRVARPRLAGGSPRRDAADVPAGASFVYPIMSKWSADYAGASKKVNYQSIGSAAASPRSRRGTVDFGSSTPR
jgi:hypothetical protein